MLRRPIITEKTMNLTKLGLYTFEVSPEVSKLQIAKLIKDKFNVDVISIKTVNIAGKKKMQRARRRHYYTKDIRKAILKLSALGRSTPRVSDSRS